MEGLFGLVGHKNETTTEKYMRIDYAQFDNATRSYRGMNTQAVAPGTPISDNASLRLPKIAGQRRAEGCHGRRLCPPDGSDLTRKICHVAQTFLENPRHLGPKLGPVQKQKKEPPGKTGGSSYAGIALCSSRDT